MSRIRIVKGKITEIIGGDLRYYSKSDIIEIAGEGYIERSGTRILNAGNPEPIPKFETQNTKVKTIICIDDLDEGSANDNSGTATKKGVLYNKSYRFEVTQYTDDHPINPNRIRWAISYTDPETGQRYNNILNKDYRGDRITIHFASTEYCGRDLEVRAYIENADAEGKLAIFQHNRFRWFDEKFFEKELKERTHSNMPWRINQADTSLCGMACIFYLFAKEQPEAYEKFSRELFRTGESTFNDFTVKPSIDLLEKKINAEGYPIGTGNMRLIDFVTLAGTMNTCNPKYKGGNEEFQAINWPWIMIPLCKKLLGYKTVFAKGVYNPIKPIAYTNYSIKNKIDDINQQIDDGYRLILMIDSDLIDDQWNFDSFDLHWVVLESPIYWDDNKDEIDFKVYTWGIDPNGPDRYLEKPISPSHFMNNYNGYIKVK